MASIGFTNSSFTLKMDKAVKSVNFGFPGASNLVNLAPEPRHEITGHSYIAVVIYNVAGTSPRTFLAPPSSFAFGAGESITLTLGGPKDQTIVATDVDGNTANWHALAA